MEFGRPLPRVFRAFFKRASFGGREVIPPPTTDDDMHERQGASGAQMCQGACLGNQVQALNTDPDVVRRSSEEPSGQLGVCCA